jgi:phosphatidylinositol-3-phosphatase
MNTSTALRALTLLALGSLAHAAPGVPRFDHVVIVIEENHAYSQIIGSASAPYINALAAGGALMTQSFALTHPSQPNYVALFSGSTQGVTTDGVYPHSQFTAPNLGAKLLAAGRGFGGYSETMPSVGFDGASAGTAPATYKRKHNPWVNWQDATDPLPANKLPPAVNMPYAGFFPAASDYDSLPTLSFVIPNQLHDMHDGTIAQGDSWLQSNLSAYADWCGTHDSLLIVTFDEDNGSQGNHIATIFYGASVVPGEYAETIDHYSVLRTLEDMYGLPHDAGSATATTITDIWAAPTWTDLGSGLAGVAGVPSLVGTGTLAAGSAGSLALTAANPSAAALLFVSLASSPVAFKGGTLVAFPSLVTVPLVTQADGTLLLPFTWPAGVPSATPLWFQDAISDPAAIHQVALSDALMATTP